MGKSRTESKPCPKHSRQNDPLEGLTNGPEGTSVMGGTHGTHGTKGPDSGWEAGKVGQGPLKAAEETDVHLRVWNI